jgi:hypothetical protein
MDAAAAPAPAAPAAACRGFTTEAWLRASLLSAPAVRAEEEEEGRGASFRGASLASSPSLPSAPSSLSPAGEAFFLERRK